MQNFQGKEDQQKAPVMCTARISIGFIAFVSISAVAAAVYYLLAR